jgi:hypothetical protein
MILSCPCCTFVLLGTSPAADPQHNRNRRPTPFAEKNWTGGLRALLVYNFTTLQQHNNNVFKNLNLMEITFLSLKYKVEGS